MANISIHPPQVRRNTNLAAASPVALEVAITIGLLAALLGLLVLDAPSPRHQPLGLALAAMAMMAGPTIAVFFIERSLPSASPRKTPRQVLVHTNIMLGLFVSMVVASACTRLMVGGVSHAFHVTPGLFDLRLPKGGGIFLIGVGYVFFIFVYDFFYYWRHRFLHSIPLLWAHHEVHHRDSKFDVCTGYTQNWVDAFISIVFIKLPGLILFKFDGFNPVEMGIINGAPIILVLIYLHTNHSSLKLELGKATVLIVGPQSHRIHHSTLPEHRGRNFSAFFPFWDIVFGTFYHPKPGEFPPTGLNSGREVQSTWEVEMNTPRKWWRMARAWFGSKSKKRVKRGLSSPGGFDLAFDEEDLALVQPTERRGSDY